MDLKIRTAAAAIAVLYALSALGQKGAVVAGSAWKNGTFHMDAAAVVSRSAIVLERPNLESEEAMPLGNGRLGAAVWSGHGFAAQLNRADAMPGRLSAGMVVIPGLDQLLTAKDYRGRLDLFRGEFEEQGGGMSLTAFVDPDCDALVVDVTGALPQKEQEAELRLWKPRKPRGGTLAHGAVWLAENWIDDKNPGASGRPFGTLAALQVEGRDAKAMQVDERTVMVRFRPDATGHFRLLVAAPQYDGSGDAESISKSVLAKAYAHSGRVRNSAWWGTYWKRAGLIRIDSPDAVGEYMESLRAIYLYVAACERGFEWPGSQAGVADMVSAAGDVHKWDPSAFWHWNLRMQVAANLTAGLPELNEPYFRLYRDHLKDIEIWTRQHMHGLPGACIPETMRFNGQGFEFEGQWTPVAMGMDCATDFRPYYNARTRTTGAEVGLWVWEQYLATGSLPFLEQNYPLMKEGARFLLASQKAGPDGWLHTGPSNAHETQWDVQDPTTDLAAIKALFPSVIAAARILGRDMELAAALAKALKQTPGFPHVSVNSPHVLLATVDDGKEQEVIGESYQPDAPDHNVENIGLEPVWPYGLIGDRSPDFVLARRTFAHRPSPTTADWSYDPIQAARLGMNEEVASTLKILTEKSQQFPNGMARLDPSDTEFYVEQAGVVAAALAEALVQDYDGIIRIAPAIPPQWDFSGSVWVRGRTRVDVQTLEGHPTTVVINPGRAGMIQVRNPWPDQSVVVIEGEPAKPVATRSEKDVLSFKGVAGEHYLIRPRSGKILPFKSVSGRPASGPKRMGPVTIGIFRARPAD